MRELELRLVLVYGLLKNEGLVAKLLGWLEIINAALGRNNDFIAKPHDI